MEPNDQLELIKDYLEEALEFIGRFEDLLMDLEQDAAPKPRPELINEILGLLHTFKGNSGMMGFAGLQKYTHKLEDLFKAVESETIAYGPNLIESAMQCASTLRRGLSQLSPETPQDPITPEDILALEAILADRTNGGAAAKVNAAAERPAELTLPKKTNVIKVDFERLDDLLNLMGELVIYRTRLGRIEGQAREVLGEKGLSLDLTDTTELIGKITTELHESIMRVRMLPIKQVFMRFPRMVRDLARERGKQISLQFEGGGTELDKTVIDEIGEPLLHLIRNAADHGIEAPAERLAAGKPAQGTVCIRASQESSHIVITVEDDGRGIDEQRLRRKAIECGALSGAEENRRDLIDLIFLPGLSTAEAVSEVSGRGLGMDVVKKSLARISGGIEVESEPGLGTRFTIKLPLTLAIISALMVEVSGEQYAVPLAAVAESIKTSRSEIHLVNNREVTRVRERVLPLIRLSDLFGLPASKNGGALYVVVVQTSTGQAGLVVDSLLGKQEIVIKPLDDYLGKATGVAGATILGDGKVVLIVDVLGLIEKLRRERRGGEKEEGHA